MLCYYATYSVQPHCSSINRAIISQASRRFVNDSWPFLFAISKWRMASNVLRKTFRNHNNSNCDRIFLANRQLSLIPLNRTAVLSAALGNLTHPR